MKNIILFICLLFASTAKSQVIYQVEKFSDDFSATVTVNESTDDVFKKGVIKVFNANKDVIIQIDSEEMTFELKDDVIEVSTLELPYGRQSPIIYQDFNFDGKEDLALQDGQFSCYHGPSYQVYLREANDFTLNESFTRLAQDYCGMFQVDSENKKINTMTKSGCCWHEYSEFKVENNEPKAIRIIEESMVTYPFFEMIIQEWNGSEMVETKQQTIDLENEDVTRYFSFTVKENGKKLYLFSANNDILHYVLLTKEGYVEFHFPTNMEETAQIFQLSADEDELIFTTSSAIYLIYQKKEDNQNTSVGIKVETGGKTYDLKGDVSTIKGNLSSLLGKKLENVKE